MFTIHVQIKNNSYAFQNDKIVIYHSFIIWKINLFGFQPHFEWRANNYRNPINFLHYEDEMDYFFSKEFCDMLEEMNTKHKCQQRKKFGSRNEKEKILRICYLYESRLDPSFIIFYLEYTLLNFVKDNQMQNILQGEEVVHYLPCL